MRRPLVHAQDAPAWEVQPTSAVEALNDWCELLEPTLQRADESAQTIVIVLMSALDQCPSGRQADGLLTWRSLPFGLSYVWQKLQRMICQQEMGVVTRAICGSPNFSCSEGPTIYSTSMNGLPPASHCCHGQMTRSAKREALPNHASALHASTSSYCQTQCVSTQAGMSVSSACTSSSVGMNAQAFRRAST